MRRLAIDAVYAVLFGAGIIAVCVLGVEQWRGNPPHAKHLTAPTHQAAGDPLPPKTTERVERPSTLPYPRGPWAVEMTIANSRGER